MGMSREELFKGTGFDLSKMPSEEIFRQTGRTTRMVKDAIYYANNNEQAVVIVVHDDSMIGYVRALLKDAPGISVIAYDTDRPMFNWNTLKATGEYAFHHVFIDHDVIYHYQRRILELFSKYDPKFDIKGDTMTFVDNRPSAADDNKYAVGM